MSKYILNSSGDATVRVRVPDAHCEVLALVMGTIYHKVYGEYLAIFPKYCPAQLVTCTYSETEYSEEGPPVVDESTPALWQETLC